MHVVPVRFSEDPDIPRSFWFTGMTTGVGENAEPLDRVRSAVWGMLYARRYKHCLHVSGKGLAKMMTAIVDVFEAAGLAASEKGRNHAAADTEPETPLTLPLVIEAAGQR